MTPSCRGEDVERYDKGTMVNRLEFERNVAVVARTQPEYTQHIEHTNLKRRFGSKSVADSVFQ